MNTFEIRWKNFRNFKDTKWITIRPITILIGCNASGKTSFIAPLLILKQTLESADPNLALKTVGTYFDAGSYENLIHAHDKSSALSFSIRFNRKSTPKDKKLKEVGHYPPGELTLEFGFADIKESPILNKYTVKDIYGRTMISRRKLKSGKYSVSGILSNEKTSGLLKTIKDTVPENFLFTAESIFAQRVEEQIKSERKKKDNRKEIKIEFSIIMEKYLRAISFTKSHIERIFRGITYIGPLSEPPRRMYELSGEKPEGVGTRGEFAPEIIYRERSTQLFGLVNKWIKAFDFGDNINCNKLSDGVFSLTLNKKKNSPQVNIADTGFGLSQVLPLIVQGLYSDQKGMLIAEQPEVHLNPRLQSLLADLFVDVSSKGTSVLVETHSEHLLLRLRRLIAEGKINASDVALYYVETKETEPTIDEIQISEEGHIKSDTWPKGFFEDALYESMALVAAQRKKK